MINTYLSQTLTTTKTLFVTEIPRPHKKIHSLPNISQGNTVRIHTDEQNLCDKNEN